MLRRQLVYQLRPESFHDGPHFVGNVFNHSSVENEAVEPLQADRRHQFAPHDAGLIWIAASDPPFLPPRLFIGLVLRGFNVEPETEVPMA